MRVNRRTVSILALIGLSIGSLGTGIALTNRPQIAAAAPVVQQAQPTEESASEDGDTLQEPAYTGSIAVDQAAQDGLAESEEAAALQSQAGITAEQAQSAAEAANPGTRAIKTELDNENGYLVYSVELDSGSDAKVDAGTGAVLQVETAGSENKQVSDSDTVEEEVYDPNESGKDEANDGEAAEPAEATDQAAPAAK